MQLILSQEVLMIRYHILKARTHILMDNVFCNQNCWGINSSCESHTNIHNLAHLFKGCNGQLSVVYNLYKTNVFWESITGIYLKCIFTLAVFTIAVLKLLYVFPYLVWVQLNYFCYSMYEERKSFATLEFYRACQWLQND